MKTKRWLTILLAVFIASLMMASIIQAQGTVVSLPTQLTMASSRGDIEIRTLLLQSTETITNIQAVTVDLPSADGESVLPASAIKVFVPNDTLAANEMMTLTVTVDMGQVASGEYQGNLFIDYSSGQLSVPLTVKVKDNWYVPLVTLLFGIGLAMGITYYRTKVKPRDEVMVRAGQLQAQMKKDNALAEPFKKAIDADMVDVEVALQTQKWEEAQAAIDKADGCWQRWRRYRRDWLEQLAYYATLMTSLDEADPASNIAYVQTIKRAVSDSQRTVADMETPDPLRQTLEPSGQQLNQYKALAAKIDEIGQKAGDLDQAGETKWRKQAVSWQNQLNELDPSDETAYKELQKGVTAGLGQINEEIANLPELEVFRGGGEKGIFDEGFASINLLGTVPALVDTNDVNKIAQSSRNLRFFAMISYVVAVGLLAGVGFAELYVGRPTFGATTWSDYFALLAWGFGAEASRSAVVDLVQGWGIS